MSADAGEAFAASLVNRKNRIENERSEVNSMAPNLPLARRAGRRFRGMFSKIYSPKRPPDSTKTPAKPSPAGEKQPKSSADYVKTL